MVFDFDRTLHQVKKTGQLPTPRVLLKLHFIALDSRYQNSIYTSMYIKFVSLCYVVYYRVARFTEQLGTDPSTFIGFFFGILWEYPFYPEVRRRVEIACSFIIANRAFIHNSLVLRAPHKIAVYSTADIFALYLCIVFWVWLSHVMRQYNIFCKRR